MMQLQPFDPRDTRILAEGPRYQALYERQQILLRDNGGCIGLHPVRDRGHDAMYLRAVPHGDCMLIVFDLRDVCPSLDEIREHHAHDVNGLVLYTFRAAFKTAPEALAAMVARPIDVLTLPALSDLAPGRQAVVA
jgi:hypothetical protein